jgi:hypothetical protein
MKWRMGHPFADAGPGLQPGLSTANQARQLSIGITGPNLSATCYRRRGSRKTPEILGERSSEKLWVGHHPAGCWVRSLKAAG